MNKENLKAKFKKYQTYVLAALLIVSAIGISYAAFTFTKESNENVLSTGQISMSYIEPDNSYVVEDALPMKDIDAMAINNYFEFTVSSHATTNLDDGNEIVIPYEISLGELAVDGDKTKLTKDQIKVYITKVESGKETVVNGPILLSELVESTKRDNALVIYNATDIHKNAGSEITTTYRIRAWIDYNVDASNFTKDNRYQYKFNVNVNSIVGAQEYYNYCFATSKVTNDSGEVIGVSVDDYYCYEGNDKGYEVRTDVVIPSSFLDGYKLVENPSEDAILSCKNYLMNNFGVTEEEDELATALCSGQDIDGMTLLDLIDLALTEGLDISQDMIDIGVVTFSTTSYPVIRIGDQSFTFKKLTSVVIPDSVTTIGEYAFKFNNLTSVVIPDSVTTIELGAFYYSNLTSVVIPDSVTTIGDGAFYDNNLTSVVIPDSVTTIRESAFQLNNLTSVVIPDSVTKIGNYAFGSNNLTSVVIPDSVTTIGESAFQLNNLTSVVIPDSVTTIGEFAFQFNNLTSVVIPDSVTTIGKSTFSSNNLTSVVIPDSVTKIEASAFNGNNLTSVVIPDSVTTIGESAFSSNNLTSVVIPDSVTTIGKSAFGYNNLTSVVIGKNSQLTNIGSFAFNSSVNSNEYLTIYNNSGKSFDWKDVVHGQTGTPFVTGTVTATGVYNEVIIKEGYPS